MSRCYSVEVIHVPVSIFEEKRLDAVREEPVIYADLGKAIRFLVDNGFVEYPQDFYPKHRSNIIWHGKGKTDENGYTFASIYMYEFIS